MYRNQEMIADRIMPRQQVGGERFTWKQYRIGEAFKRVNTLVGRIGQVQDMEFGYDERDGGTRDYGLQNPVPQKDIDNAPPGYNPLDDNTIQLTNWIELDREKRVADIVFNVNNYAPNNVITLAGSDQFSNYIMNPADPTAESSPITVIEEAMESMIAQPNLCVMGRRTWGIIRRHPRMISAFHGNDGTSGLMSQAFFQELFGVELVVGSSWVDNARAGQAPTRDRLWNGDVALLRIDNTANIQSGMTWGMTAQWRNRVTYRWFDQDIGLDGGQLVRVGEHCAEIVTAPEYGFIIKAAHA
jgi:hypothetical protein